MAALSLSQIQISFIKSNKGNNSLKWTLLGSHAWNLMLIKLDYICCSFWTMAGIDPFDWIDWSIYSNFWPLPLQRSARDPNRTALNIFCAKKHSSNLQWFAAHIRRSFTFHHRLPGKNKNTQTVKETTNWCRTKSLPSIGKLHSLPPPSAGRSEVR